MSKLHNFSKILLIVTFFFGKQINTQEVFQPSIIEIRMCIERVNKCLDDCNKEYPSQYTKFPEYKRNSCREECVTYPENRICSSLFKSSYK